MSRRSKRKQYRNGKESKRFHWKNSNLNGTASLNHEGVRRDDNFLIDNSVLVTCESDSDPDLSYHFFSETEAYRSKSDSELNKLLRFSSDISTYDGDPSQEDSYIERNHLKRAFESCFKTLIKDSVSSSNGAEYIFNWNTKNTERIFSQSRISENFCLDLRKNISEVIISRHYRNDNIKNEFSTSVRKEENRERLVESEKKMKVYWETREREKLGEVSKKRSKNEMDPKKITAASVNYSSEDSFFQMFENQRHFKKEQNFCCKENKEESKIFIECTKTEKQLLNCSLLHSEPKNKSTPLIKITKQSNRKMSSPDLIKIESNVSCNSNIKKKEEFLSCSEELLSKDGMNEDESLDFSFHTSCYEETYESIEAITKVNCDGRRKVMKTVSCDEGVQCDLLLSTEGCFMGKHDGINTEMKTLQDSSEGDFLIRSAVEEFENKLNNVVFSSTINMTNDIVWGVNELPTDDVDVSITNSDETTSEKKHFFKVFSKLFTRSALQKILRILSVVPIDKLLEFFCLTFSVPLIETMAISISITKVMNIFSTIISFSNFNRQIRNYGSKAADYLKTGFGSFADLFVKIKVDDISGRKDCSCFCDVKKFMDLEKRLKNLENQLTKFQVMDKEIEKLKEVARSLEELALAGKAVTTITTTTTTTTPPLLQLPDIATPPPPPPPPPLPPAPSLVKPLIIAKKSPRKQNVMTRPSITVEDLQKVTLRKVTAVERPTYEKKGPVISLEMLRSVKLRSNPRKKSDTCSPTRTQSSRDRLRKIKSPAFRSSSRSSERKPRFSSIPLSEILNMDESYQFMDSERVVRE